MWCVYQTIGAALQDRSTLIQISNTVSETIVKWGRWFCSTELTVVAETKKVPWLTNDSLYLHKPQLLLLENIINQIWDLSILIVWGFTVPRLPQWTDLRIQKFPLSWSPGFNSISTSICPHPHWLLAYMLGDLLSGYPHELILHTPLYIYSFSFMDIIPFHLDVWGKKTGCFFFSGI